MNSKTDFFKLYFNYVGETEAPYTFHRWAAIASIAALIGRQAWLPWGHGQLYFNKYIMLMGQPGTRKTSTISIAGKALERVGYKYKSANRSSPERFLVDLQRSVTTDNFEEIEELEQLTFDLTSEQFIMADEFGDFIGRGNIDFAILLGTLWDCLPEYTHPKIHGKSIRVTKPTVNMLVGSTPQGLALAIPPEAIGQGFMSRVLLIHAEATGRKLDEPTAPSKQAVEELDERLREISRTIRGPFSFTAEAKEIRKELYRKFKALGDSRFEHYTTRRYTHLLKLACILSAANLRNVVHDTTLVHANTILAAAEDKMAKALGEYGRSKFAEISNSVMEIVANAPGACTLQYIWKRVSHDLAKQQDLIEILKNLTQAEKLKIYQHDGKSGYIPGAVKKTEWDAGLIDKEYLFAEER